MWKYPNKHLRHGGLLRIIPVEYMAIISPKEGLPGAARAKKRHNTMKNNHKPIARFIHRDRLRNPRLGDTHYYERTTLFTFLSRYFATDAICRVFSRYGLLVDLEHE